MVLALLSRRQTLRAAIAAASPLSLRGQVAKIDQDAIEGLFKELQQEEHRDLKGVRILLDGKLAAESFFNESGPEKLHDIRSAAKSITSLLLGVAIEKKMIPGIDTPFTSILGGSKNASLNRITFEHLLTMRSGLAANDEDPESPGNENRMDDSPSWVDFALSVPALTAPNLHYQYCSLNAFLVGACVENASGLPLDEFADQHLFKPLGIGRFEWRRGPQNRVAGQGNLRVTLATLTSIGQMCLQRGSFGSRSVVNEKWIAQSTASIVPIAQVDPFADAYGYMWYAKSHDAGGRPVRVNFASGNGGNKIYTIPALRMTVGITSSAYGRPYAQRRSQRILTRILQAVNA